MSVTCIHLERYRVLAGYNWIITHLRSVVVFCVRIHEVRIYMLRYNCLVYVLTILQSCVVFVITVTAVYT